MLKNYIIMAFKVMLRRKFLTAISLFGISFTLAVLLIVTAIIDQKIGANPPEIHRNRTLYINLIHIKSKDGLQSAATSPSYYFLNQYVRPLTKPEKVSIHRGGHFTSFIRGKRQNLVYKYTDEQYWDILNYRFLEGGPFRKKDVQDANRVAVINEATRQRYFGNAPALGKQLFINGANYQIMGVVENTSQAMETSYADVWLPLSCDFRSLKGSALTGQHQALILAHSPDDFAAINAELQHISRNLTTGDARYPALDVVAYSSLENFSKSPNSSPAVAQTFAIIITLMVLFMVLPTVNLVNITISRIMERSSEIGLRKAVGATSLTLTGQFIVENIMLTLVGGAIGLAVSILFIQIISHGSIHLSWRVFAYALALCVFFGLFSGVYPAYRMSRLHAAHALKGGMR